MLSEAPKETLSKEVFKKKSYQIAIISLAIFSIQCF